MSDGKWSLWMDEFHERTEASEENERLRRDNQKLRLETADTAERNKALQEEYGILQDAREAERYDMEEREFLRN